MHSIIYRFIVIPGKETQFIQAWEQLTEYIYNHYASNGSRLHKSTDGEYIAYAQWPDKHTYQAIHNTLPKEAEAIRTKMRATCSKVEVLYQLSYVKDKLKSASKSQ